MKMHFESMQVWEETEQQARSVRHNHNSRYRCFLHSNARRGNTFISSRNLLIFKLMVLTTLVSQYWRRNSNKEAEAKRRRPDVKTGTVVGPGLPSPSFFRSFRYEQAPLQSLGERRMYHCRCLHRHCFRHCYLHHHDLHSSYLHRHDVTHVQLWTYL